MQIRKWLGFHFLINWRDEMPKKRKEMWTIKKKETMTNSHIISTGIVWLFFFRLISRVFIKTRVKPIRFIHVLQKNRILKNQYYKIVLPFLNGGAIFFVDKFVNFRETKDFKVLLSAFCQKLGGG